MADTKISALPAATLPLAGTEVLPIVQGGVTEKVAVDDLTVKNLRSNATTGILQVAGPGTGATRTMTTPDANFTAARTDAAQTFSGLQSFSGAGSENIRLVDTAVPNATTLQQTGAITYFNGNMTLPGSAVFAWRHTSSYTQLMILNGSTGDLTNNTGSFVVSTAGKGVSLPGGITWTSGAGSPEGVVTAPVGSLYSRSDGGLLTSLYVKQSGSGNTGWAGK